MEQLTQYLWIFFVSMLPLAELRGSILMGAAMGLWEIPVYLISVVGNFLPVPFILLFIRAILAWMKRCPVNLFRKIAEWLEQKANKHASKVEKYAFWGLLILVAIPLPGTGAWTGALVAALFRVKLRVAVPAIFLGVLGAGIIVTLISYGVLSFLSFLL